MVEGRREVGGSGVVAVGRRRWCGLQWFGWVFGSGGVFERWVIFRLEGRERKGVAILGLLLLLLILK